MSTLLQWPSFPRQKKDFLVGPFVPQPPLLLDLAKAAARGELLVVVVVVDGIDELLKLGSWRTRKLQVWWIAGSIKCCHHRASK